MARRIKSKQDRIREVLNNRNRRAINSEKNHRIKKIVSSVRRSAKIIPDSYRSNRSILLTGGIGDVLAIEAFLPDEQRAFLSTILYATPKYKIVREIFCALPNYPRLEHHQVVWDDFSNFWCFYKRDGCISHLHSIGRPVPNELTTCQDLSIATIFPLIKIKCLKFTGSSLVKHTVADIRKFDLPNAYITLCPYSTDKRFNTRDFQEEDWRYVIQALERRNIVGVIVNSGGDICPDHHRLINLTNKTNILEGIEILKAGIGYWGIDSAFSVTASELFTSPNLVIKSRNPHCINHTDCYYPKQPNLQFINPDLSILEHFWTAS